jgi:hypothetical protein
LLFRGVKAPDSIEFLASLRRASEPLERLGQPISRFGPVGKGFNSLAKLRKRFLMPSALCVRLTETQVNVTVPRVSLGTLAEPFQSARRRALLQRNGAQIVERWGGTRIYSQFLLE